MEALTATATAFQIVSGVCDTNSLLGTNDSLLKGLVPSSNEHLIAVIFANLEQTGDVLQVLSKMVEDRGTDEHKDQYNSVYREQSRRLKTLEAKQGSSNSKAWFTVLRLGFDFSKAKSLRELRDDVVKNKHLVSRTSKDIRDTLMNIGAVSILSSSDVELDSGAEPSGAEPSITSGKHVTPLQNSPPEVQFFTAITTKNGPILTGSSMPTGAPLHRVNSTESWYAIEMQGAVPLKKWTKQ
ncbi:hypothetical protein D9757_008683 [Collybiopsis confluens]|uniref:Uncharacterized protein n=1 Tax=Collybiopsis confluens TaxID=2823264 RepID=A0A8H5H431_9AGAR|nr:hypothetical protein D9757_008683 [Collybiopsis confluens]